MDNNDFFDNKNDEDNEQDNVTQNAWNNDSSEDAHQADSQAQDNSTSHNDDAGHNDEEQNRNGQEYRSRVNPDQWQRYRQSQGQNGNNGQWQNNGGNQYWNQNQYYQNGYQNNPYQQGPNGYYRPDNSRGFGIASMVLGIISLLCFCSFLNLIPAILAIIFGVISLSQKKDNAFAIAGIVCAAISLALLIVTIILFVGNTDFMNALRNYGQQYSNGFGYYFR